MRVLTRRARRVERGSDGKTHRSEMEAPEKNLPVELTELATIIGATRCSVRRSSMESGRFGLTPPGLTAFAREAGGPPAY
jgi:hypothetical protein